MELALHLSVLRTLIVACRMSPRKHTRMSAVIDWPPVLVQQPACLQRESAANSSVNFVGPTRAGADPSQDHMDTVCRQTALNRNDATQLNTCMKATSNFNQFSQALKYMFSIKLRGRQCRLKEPRRQNGTSHVGSEVRFILG